MKTYFWNLLRLFDITCNTGIGGDPRMTLSSRMGRDMAEGKCAACTYVCAFLNLFQKNHCAIAWASEQVAPVQSDQVAKE
ncbi:hypothetical protein AAKU67_002216 [Oxalobacteraceae bacterium GrIS 2.11]